MESRENWHVLIFEETARGLTGLAHAIAVGPDHDDAVTRAVEAAAKHRPVRPTMPRGRKVYKTAPDSWTVEVTGAYESFIFVVTIARLVYEGPG